jgi:4-carboxymuconolactone decarboxylase
MSDDMRELGLSVRRKVLGDRYVDAALAKADDFSMPFQDFLNEVCWGKGWGDEALSHPQRSLLNLGMLAALGRMQEFETHFRGALRNGLTRDELRATLIQIAIYCGVPAGVECFRAAARVLSEYDPTEPPAP